MGNILITGGAGFVGSHLTEALVNLIKNIFSSSREVYGNALYLPVDENHPLNPCNPYGASKIAGEKIIELL